MKPIEWAIGPQFIGSIEHGLKRTARVDICQSVDDPNAIGIDMEARTYREKEWKVLVSARIGVERSIEPRCTLSLIKVVDMLPSEEVWMNWARKLAADILEMETMFS